MWRAARVALLCAGLAACGAEPAAPGGVADGSAAARPDPAPVRVRVERVREERIARAAEVSGVVHAFRKATVAAEVSGRVVVRRVEPGRRVEVGDALVSLDATRLRLDEEQARATLAAREVDLEEARRDLARGEQLARESTISESRLDALRFAVERAESARGLARVALRRAQRAVADARVAAPFAGSVEAVHVDVGDFVNAAAPVATLVDLSRARLRAGVTAAEAAGLEVGGSASVRLEDQGVELSGEIQSVGRIADPASGTYAVELWVENGDGQLREGMIAAVRFDQGDGARRAVVPRSALIRQGGRLSLFVVERDGAGERALARRVRIGRRDRDDVEILEGARVGERVVVDGLFALRDGAAVFVESGSTDGVAEAQVAVPTPGAPL